MESSMRPGLRLVDRLLLIGAWAISCSAVYGLGFYTGSQIQERVPDDEERIVRLPVTAEPPAAGQRAKGGEDFTFYDTLVQGPPRTRQSDAVTADRSAPEPAGPAKPETREDAQRLARLHRDGLEVHGEERDREDGRCERGAQDRPRRKDGEGIVVAQGLVARARDDDGVACEGRRDRHAGEARVAHDEVRVGRGRRGCRLPQSDRRRPVPRRPRIRGALRPRPRPGARRSRPRTRNAHVRASHGPRWRPNDDAGPQRACPARVACERPLAAPGGLPRPRRARAT